MKTINEWEITTDTVLLFILVLLFSIAGIFIPGFLKIDNLLNISRIVSLTGIIAIGATYVMLIGEIDLSVGAIMSLSAVIGGQFLFLGTGPILLITFTVGLFLGLINGIGVVKGKIPSLIMTLATMTIYSGLANIVSGGKAVYPYTLESYLWLGTGSIAGIPFPAVVFCTITLVSYFILNFTEFGKWIYYIGANRTASRYSGGHTDRYMIITFLISGICASMVGPMISGQINRIWSTQGAGYELTTIAVIVLGGISLTGGRGTIKGTFIAAFIFGMLMNILNLTGVGTYLQDVVKGGLLVTVVGLMYLKEEKIRTA